LSAHVTHPLPKRASTPTTESSNHTATTPPPPDLSRRLSLRRTLLQQRYKCSKVASAVRPVVPCATASEDARQWHDWKSQASRARSIAPLASPVRVPLSTLQQPPDRCSHSPRGRGIGTGHSRIPNTACCRCQRTATIGPSRASKGQRSPHRTSSPCVRLSLRAHVMSALQGLFRL
jgi:hypothetical protein